MFHLVTGGSGSGKSEYAENLIVACGMKEPDQRKYYIATMMPFGEETKQKIARHRKMREGKGFITIECYTKLKEQMKRFFEDHDEKKPFILLECMSNLTANEMYADDGSGDKAAETIIEGIRFLNENSQMLVFVTNEVFSESEPDTPEMVKYKQTLGAINYRMAQMAERVTEVVYGISVEVK